jgi:hypothetical protein
MPLLAAGEMAKAGRPLAIPASRCTRRGNKLNYSSIEASQAAAAGAAQAERAFLLNLLEQTLECARQLGVNLDGDHEEAEMMLKMRGKAAMVAGGTPLAGSPYQALWTQWAWTVVSNDVSSAPQHGAMQHFLLQLRGALAAAPALALAPAPAPASA